MLDGIDAIDWSELQDAYGPATNVPTYLKGLTLDDAKLWGDALFYLYLTICHQRTTVTRASCAAVPFLVEIVGNPRVRCRGNVTKLLADIALCGLRQVATPEENSEGAWSAEELSLLQKDGRAVCEALQSASPALAALLEDEDPKVRVVAPCLMAWHAPDSERVRQLLGDRLLSEQDAVIRASVFYYLGELRTGRERSRAIFREALQNPRSHPEQIVAALQLAKDESEWNVSLQQFLSDSLENITTLAPLFERAETHSDWRHHPMGRAWAEHLQSTGANIGADSGEEDFQFPWFESGLKDELTSRLLAMQRKLGGPLAESVWKNLCRELGNGSMLRNQDALKAVFPERRMPGDASSLTIRQREALTLIYTNLRWWASSTPVGHLIRGLPKKRSDLARYLDIIDEEPAALLLERIVRIQLKLADDAPLNEASLWRVTSLTFESLGRDEFLPALSQFPNLHRLSLQGSAVTDSGITTISTRLPLTHVLLGGTTLGDTALLHLSQFPTLEQVWIGGNITDAGLALALPRLPHLKDVGLIGSGVTDAAIPSLAALPALENVFLTSTGITEAGELRLRESAPRIRRIMR